MKKNPKALSNVVLALSCFTGASALQADEYTTLEPIGSSANPQYLTVHKQSRPSNLDAFSHLEEQSALLGPGLIGRRYFLASYDYSHDNKGFGVVSKIAQFSPVPSWVPDMISPNTHGATIRGNFPVTFWMDFGLQYSYQKMDWDSGMYDNSGNFLFTTDGDSERHDFMVDLTFHHPVVIDQKWTVKPYARAMLGMVYEEFDFNATDYFTDPSGPTSFASSGDDTEGVYAVEAGVEIPIGDNFAITPFVGWRDYLDGDYGHGTCVYGGRANLYFGHGIGLLASVAGSNHSELFASIGLTFSF